MKALGCQPVESTSLFKVVVSDINLHPYTAAARRRAAAVQRDFVRDANVGKVGLFREGRVGLSRPPCDGGVSPDVRLRISVLGRGKAVQVDIMLTRG